MQTFLKLFPIPLIIALVLSSGCEKKRFTFDAEVDGVALNIYYSANAHYVGSQLHIGAIQFKPDTTVLTIDLNAKGIGTYVCNVDDPRTGNAAAYSVHSRFSGTIYATNNRSAGTVTITEFNLEEHKLSGSFQFQASQVQPPGSKVVNVKGSFEDLPLVH